MDIAFRVGSAAVANFLSGLGCIFLLSQLLVLLKGKPDRLRVAAIGCVQGLASLVSMALSFEIVDGVIGQLAFPLIVISGIVGSPAAAVITGVFAAIFRLGVGGHRLCVGWGRSGDAARRGSCKTRKKRRDRRSARQGMRKVIFSVARFAMLGEASRPAAVLAVAAGA